MSTRIGQVNVAYRYYFPVRTASGAPDTGRVIGDFTIEVTIGGTTVAIVALTEVGNGFYFFEISAAFSLANGVGTYGVSIAKTAGNPDVGGGAVEFYVASLDQAVALAAIQADTDDIQTRLPAALVGGRMDSDVAVLQPNVINAAAIATNAIDADALAADAIGSSELATSAVNEIRDSILADSTAFNGADVGTILGDTNDIQTRLPAGLVGGRMDSDVGNIQAAVLQAIVDSILDENLFTHATTGTVGRYLIGAGGASAGINVMLDGGPGVANATYNINNQLTAGRMRFFDTAVNMDAATAGNAGLEAGEAFTAIVGAGDTTFTLGNTTAVPQVLQQLLRRAA